MKKKRPYVSLLAMFFAVFISVVPVLAESQEMTQAEKIQQALLDGKLPKDVDTDEGEIQSEQPSDADQQDASETDITSGEIPLEELNSRIEKINQQNPDADEVKALRDAFNKLSTADKLKITNIGLLESAEKHLDELEKKRTGQSSSDDSTISKPNPNSYSNSDQSDRNNQGTEHIFIINDEQPAVSIVASYMTDDNNDGVYDTPEFTLKAPDGKTFDVISGMQNLTDGVIDATFTWTPMFFQMDLRQSMGGIWTLTSSIPVAFKRTTYKSAYDINPYYTPTPTPTVIASSSSSSSVATSQGQDFDELENGGGPGLRAYTPVFKLAGLLLVLIGGLVVFMFYTNNKFGTGKAKIGSKIKKPSFNTGKLLKGKKNEPEKQESDEQEIKKKTDAEIMEEVRREYEERKKKMEEIDEAVAREKEQSEEESYDFRTEQIEVTQEAYDDDDSIEDFVDHTGETGVLAEKEEPKKQYGGRFG